MLKKAALYSLLLAPILALIMVGAHVTYLLKQPYSGPDLIFTVKNGETFGKINQRLFDQGLIPNTRIFHYYSKYKDVMTKFQAGEFTIKNGSAMPEILNTLVYGQPNLTSITIPEGKNMYEIAHLVSVSGITSEEDFLIAAQNPELIAEAGVPSTNLEGYLYPETYRFAPKTPAKVVVKTMLELFLKKTAELDFTHPFLNKHQVVILASMVEKETGAKVERPAIAGVFTNRLTKRMRLESDPTTIYGIWKRYKGNIKRSDLLETTPYNTYRIPALPLGPIANPSLEAIQAVLHPETHDYLFFVSKNDGTHIFSSSYRDHSSAVDEFQKNSKARSGKSWRNLKQ